MKRRFTVIAVVSVLAWAVAACAFSSTLKGEPLGADNSISGGEAAADITATLASRTFTIEVGGVHACSEYVTSMLIASWEADSDSWLITFTGGYEPGTRIFRFHEADRAFEQVAGPPLAEACGVE